MTISTVFINNRTQAVRLPVDLRLPDGVRKVEVRAKGPDGHPNSPAYGHLKLPHLN